MPKVSDITAAIEAKAPLTLQEPWDNSGLQVGHRDEEVTGVLIALDPTPERIEEACETGANMVVSHHPLIFKGLKNITDSNRVQKAVETAVMNRIAVYSSHTSLDNTENGVSGLVARLFGAKTVDPLIPTFEGAKTGTGAVFSLPEMSPSEFIETVRQKLHLKAVRFSNPATGPSSIHKIAVCGGSGGGFIDDAVKAGVDAYITGDIRYHDFIDYADKILLVDCGHFETEALCRYLLADIIQKEFPNLAVTISTQETNPVNYL